MASYGSAEVSKTTCALRIRKVLILEVTSNLTLLLTLLYHTSYVTLYYRTIPYVLPYLPYLSLPYLMSYLTLHFTLPYLTLQWHPAPSVGSCAAPAVLVSSLGFAIKLVLPFMLILNHFHTCILDCAYTQAHIHVHIHTRSLSQSYSHSYNHFDLPYRTLPRELFRSPAQLPRVTIPLSLVSYLSWIHPGKTRGLHPHLFQHRAFT